MNHKTKKVLGCLSFSTAAILLNSVSNPALAQATAQMSEGASQKPSQVATPAQVFTFDIPSKTLLAALGDFTATTGVQIVKPNGRAITGMSVPVSGTYTPSQALARLLAGTGVSYQFSGARSVTLARYDGDPRGFYAQASGVVLDQIDVQGATAKPTSTMTPLPAYAGGQIASGGRLGLLGNKSVFDAPFTVNNYTSKLIQDQQAATVADVVANTPSVRQVQNDFAPQQNLFIRGLLFNAREYAFDGLYGLTPIYRPSLEGLERVEVLNGPSALLYGFSPSGNVGGVINLVPKRATDVPITRVTGQYISDAVGGGSFDVGRRFGDANMFGLRVNGAYRNGNTPFDNQNLETGVFTAGFDIRGDRFRMSLDFGYQHDFIKAPLSGFTVASGFAIPNAPSLTRNVQQPWETFLSDTFYGSMRTEYDLAKDWTVFIAAGGSRLRGEGFGTSPRITDAIGTLTETTSVARAAVQKQWTGEVGIRGKFDTGPINHSISVVGTTYNNDQQFGGYVTGTVFASNLYNPVFYSRPTVFGAAPSIQKIAANSVAMTDTVSIWDERLQLLGGGRYQELKTDVYSPAGLLTSSDAGNAGTKFGAVIVKPWKNVSLYVSYAEGFGFTATAPTNAVNAGQVLPPLLSQQVETGAKIDFGNVGLTAALFEIRRPSAFLNNSLVYGLNGEQRNRGFDFNTFGEVTPGLRILGGFTLLDGVLTRTSGGTFDGKQAPGVPHVQINLGGEYDLPFIPGATATARVIYTSPQYYDQANLQQIPDWTRLDLGARYSWIYNKVAYNARLNVENVTGLNYWASTGQGSLQTGTPRTFRFSVSAEF